MEDRGGSWVHSARFWKHKVTGAAWATFSRPQLPRGLPRYIVLFVAAACEWVRVLITPHSITSYCYHKSLLGSCCVFHCRNSRAGEKGEGGVCALAWMKSSSTFDGLVFVTFTPQVKPSANTRRSWLIVSKVNAVLLHITTQLLTNYDVSQSFSLCDEHTKIY